MAHQVQLAPAPHFQFDEEAAAAQITCCDQLYELIVLVITTVCKYIHEFFYGEAPPEPAPVQTPGTLFNTPKALWTHMLTFLEYEDVRNAQATCQYLSHITLQEWVNACKYVNFTRSERYHPEIGHVLDHLIEHQIFLANKALTTTKLRHFLACDFNTVISVHIEETLHSYLTNGVFIPLRNLPSLTELRVKASQPSDILPDSWERILSNSKLRTLELENVRVFEEETFYENQNWTDTLHRVTELQRLKINLNRKDHYTILSLASLHLLSDLTELDITDRRPLQSSRAPELIANIGKCAHLRILSLSINWCRFYESRDLTPLLNCKELRVLRLVDCANLEEQHIQHLRGRNIEIEGMPLVLEERKE